MAAGVAPVSAIRRALPADAADRAAAGARRCSIWSPASPIRRFSPPASRPTARPACCGPARVRRRSRRAIDLPMEGAERLLRAAAALRTGRVAGRGRWVLGATARRCAAMRGIAEMVAHHALLYADLADPVALLRRGGGGGALSRYWHYAEDAGHGDAAAVAPYSALMAASQPLVAAASDRSYRFDRARAAARCRGRRGCVRRGGGGACARFGLGLFDLPAVGERARGRLDAVGLGDRVARFMVAISCAMRCRRDMISSRLVRVLHDHDDAPALALLRAGARCVAAGRSVVDRRTDGRHAGRRAGGRRVFRLYLLAMGSGRPRTPREIAGYAGGGRLLSFATPENGHPADRPDYCRLGRHK